MCIIKLKKSTSERFFLIVMFALVATYFYGQEKNKIFPLFVIQAGYNLGESKWFVCYGAPDNTPFKIVNNKTERTVLKAKCSTMEVGFTEFNPVTNGEE